MRLKVTPKIKPIRNIRGMTQKELARLTGLEPGYISRLERGKVIPHITTAWKIAQALRVYIEEVWTFYKED